MRSLSTTRVLLISLGVVVLASFLPLGVSGYILGLLTVAYYFGVFAMAWDLLFGFAGEVNFGPTFLIGVGAYTAGILDNLYQPPIWLCLVAGALAAVARRRGAGAAGAARARALFRADHARRRADAAEFHRRRRRPDRRRNRPHRARRDLDQRQGQLRDRAVVHGGERRDPVRAVALAGRADPAGERPGCGAGRRARLQRHQAQARRLHHQRLLLRPRRRAAGVLSRHRFGQRRWSTSPSACRSSSPR